MAHRRHRRSRQAFRRTFGGIEHAFQQKGAPHAEIKLVFELTIPALTGGGPVPSQESHVDFSWISLDALAASTLEPAVLRTLIPRWHRGEPAPLWSSTW